MSEYRRQILVGGMAGVVVGIIVVAGIAYLPLGGTTTTLTCPPFCATTSPTSTIESTTTVSMYPTTANTSVSPVILGSSGMTGGDWRFSSTVNGTRFASGNTVDLNSTLTYTGTPATVRLVGPILVFKVQSYNGSTVYSFYPPQIIQPFNVTQGEIFNQHVYIPTRGWQSGQYTILIYPQIFPNSNMSLSFAVT